MALNDGSISPDLRVQLRPNLAAEVAQERRGRTRGYLYSYLSQERRDRETALFSEMVRWPPR